MDSESPAPSSLPDSEPQISEGGIDSRRLAAATAAAADGKHRLAVSSRADEELGAARPGHAGSLIAAICLIGVPRYSNGSCHAGARLRPARQKRYLDDLDEDVFEDDFGGATAMREY